MTKAHAQDISAIKTAVIQAALTLAAEYPWDEITLEDIAEKADVVLIDLTPLFAEKSDILYAFERQIDAQVKGNHGAQSLADDTPKDRLFDVLMERFDILNEHRAAVLSIIDSVTRDPKHITKSLPWLGQSMTDMLDLAGISTDGWQGALRVTGLCLVYIKTLRDWAMDDTDDLAGTMASLDQALVRAEQAAGYLNF